jgi:hypothetical protein
MADAALMVARWKRNTATAGQSYKEGIGKVRVAPGELAAAQQNRMLTNVTEAITSGRWANRVRSVSLGSWQAAAQGKGAQNYSTGVASPQAEQKLSAFAQQWAPIMNQVSDAARQIDKSTESGALQRVALVMQAGKQFKAARSGQSF